MDALATEIRRLLGPAPELASWPLVSIVVLNRDGVGHLRRLLSGLVERTDYPRLELILVDNGSGDGSLEFIRSVEAPFPISIVANPHNESFSDANNQGAELASGELLLFLNNDIEPFEAGWLRELVACLKDTQAGAVGATLVYPDEESDSGLAYRVQTRPVRLRGSSDNLSSEPYSDDRGLYDEAFGQDIDSTVVIGACLLIAQDRFRKVGGFTHGYFYGGEDEDLCLKLRERGLDVLYGGRSILIHHISSTSRQMHGEAGGSIRRGNSLLLRRRWGPRVWREYHLDRLEGGELWAAPQPQSTEADLPTLDEVNALGFCIRASRSSPEELALLEELEAELTSCGNRHLSLRDDSIDDPRGYFYDVAVYLRGSCRHIPAAGQLNVLWVVTSFDALTSIECKRYDLVVTTDPELVNRLRADAHPTPVTTLADDRPASSLIDAAHARAQQLYLPTRIDPYTDSLEPLE